MPAAPHILFAGGGAPGRLFSGLAVAAHLSENLPSAKVSFAGPGTVREKHTAAAAGCQYWIIPSQPAPHNPLQAVRFVTDNAAGYCAAHWLLREQQVSIVVGLGGYTSTAVLRAAAARGIPYILLEPNAIPSRTTGWLAAGSAMVCAGFEQVRPYLPVQVAVSITGNPVRAAFENLFRKSPKDGKSQYSSTMPVSDGDCAEQKRLVVLGGAVGARSLNESMPKALQQAGDALKNWQVIHQTGQGQLQETDRRYRRCGIEALAVTFIDEIASVLFASDLVVCRCDGTTLAELALASVPAVLVPYPLCSDDHQIANAKVFASAKACRLIDEASHKNSLDKALARELKPLLMDEHQRQEMAHKMQDLAQPEAAADIAAIISKVLYGSATTRIAA